MYIPVPADGDVLMAGADSSEASAALEPDPVTASTELSVSSPTAISMHPTAAILASSVAAAFVAHQARASDPAMLPSGRLPTASSNSQLQVFPGPSHDAAVDDAASPDAMDGSRISSAPFANSTQPASNISQSGGQNHRTLSPSNTQMCPPLAPTLHAEYPQLDSSQGMSAQPATTHFSRSTAVLQAPPASFSQVSNSHSADNRASTLIPGAMSEESQVAPAVMPDLSLNASVPVDLMQQQDSQETAGLQQLRNSHQQARQKRLRENQEREDRQLEQEREQCAMFQRRRAEERRKLQGLLLAHQHAKQQYDASAEETAQRKTDLTRIEEELNELKAQMDRVGGGEHDRDTDNDTVGAA